MPSITLSRYECSRSLLPDVCVVCGAPATTRKSRNFAWHPSWVWVLVLVNLLVMLIVALLLTRRMSVRLPVCNEHEGYWRRRGARFTISMLFIVLLVAGASAYTVTQQPGPRDYVAGFLCLGSFLAFAAWLIVFAIIQANGIRASEVTDRTLTLAGLHPEFVDAVREDRARDRDGGRYRRSQYGDERDDFDDEFDELPTQRRHRRDDREDEDDYDRRARGD